MVLMEVVQRMRASVQARYVARQRGDITNRWSRIRLNEVTASFFDATDVSALDAIEVSGQHFARRSWKSYVPTAYPDFDVCARAELPGAFGVVLAEQVLEHVPDPFAAVRTMHDLCRPGGLVHV